MPGDDLRVPAMVDPAKAEKAHAMVAAMKIERALAFETLRTVAANYITEDFARAAQQSALFLLQAQLDALTEAFEIVTGHREPSAAERAGRTS